MKYGQIKDVRICVLSSTILYIKMIAKEAACAEIMNISKISAMKTL